MNIICKNHYVTPCKHINDRRQNFQSTKCSKGFLIFMTETSCNGAVAALLELVFYPVKFSSRFYISHMNISNLHLIHHTNCQNKQEWCNCAVLIFAWQLRISWSDNSSEIWICILLTPDNTPFHNILGIGSLKEQQKFTYITCFGTSGTCLKKGGRHWQNGGGGS